MDRHIVVKHLVLNFTATTPDDHHPLAPLNELGRCKAARTRPVRAVYAPYRSKLMRPEWLVFPLFSYLKRITSGRMDDVKYGRLLMERVGVISVQVFGRPYKKLDVAKRLDEMEFEHDPASLGYEEARAFYLKWRREVFASRAAAGLA
ncbi:carbohydrate esterase family 16 protein [Apiospora arundinis]|uniref:Carbohydrate esterase family 16 protein n=1 Tax=Apiospora arundinis TaxID=335852 RepID=A0ABR2HU25_9PEZI